MSKLANLNTEPDQWIGTDFDKGLVSVIIPLYNRAHLIVETLESITEQSYRPIECIIVDDGSTDNSGAVVTRFISSYHGDVQFVYHKKDNGGPQTARNIGSILSKGEFLQYIDSDDLLFPDKLKVQVEQLRRKREFKGCYSQWCEGTTSNNVLVKTNMQDILSLEQYYNSKAIIPFSMLLYREAVWQIGEWNENLTVNEEIDYQIRFLLKGFKFKFVNCNSGLWRVHDGYKLSETNSFKNLYYYNLNIIKLIKEHNQLNNSVCKLIANRILWAVLNRKYQFRQYRIKLLKLAYSLDADLLPFQSKKVKILRRLAGSTIALKYWLYNLELR